MNPITISKTPFGDLQVFRDAASIIQHLNAHVLSAPEAHGWRLIAPEYEAEVGSQDDDRYHLAKEMLANGGAALGLYKNVYVVEIEKTCADAAAHGWFTTENGTSVAFGLTGVVVLAEKTGGVQVVVSSFIAGGGDASRVVDGDRSHCLDTPLCRESSAGPHPRREGRFSAGAERAKAKREAKRSPEERIYFERFRKAEKFVRSHPYVPSDGSSRGRHEVALLMTPIREALKAAGEASKNEHGGSTKHRNFRAWLHLWRDARGGRV